MQLLSFAELLETFAVVDVLTCYTGPHAAALTLAP